MGSGYLTGEPCDVHGSLLQPTAVSDSGLITNGVPQCQNPVYTSEWITQLFCSTLPKKVSSVQNPSSL